MNGGWGAVGSKEQFGVHGFHLFTPLALECRQISVGGCLCLGAMPRRSRGTGLISAGWVWPGDLQGLCSLSDISSIQSFHRMQTAATPLPLFTTDQTTVLTFYLKSPHSLRRQQDLEKRYYQSGALETWVIFLPPLGIYFVAEVSHLTSPYRCLVWATRLHAVDSFLLFLTF